jgi:hypothetical protein
VKIPKDAAPLDVVLLIWYNRNGNSVCVFKVMHVPIQYVAGIPFVFSMRICLFVLVCCDGILVVEFYAIFAYG